MKKLLIALVVALAFAPGSLAAQIPDCWQCHVCPEDTAMSDVSYYGVSPLQVDIPFGGCVSTDWCEGCDPNEEEQDQDTELALTELIESGGENLLGWMDEYRGEFALAVVGSTLQVSRECGQAITWLALRETELLTVTELLEQ